MRKYRPHLWRFAVVFLAIGGVLACVWWVSWVTSGELTFGSRSDSTTLLLQDQRLYLVRFKCSPAFPPAWADHLSRISNEQLSRSYAYNRRWLVQYKIPMQSVGYWKTDEWWGLSMRPIGKFGLCCLAFGTVLMFFVWMSKLAETQSGDRVRGFPID